MTDWLMQIALSFGWNVENPLLEPLLEKPKVEMTEEEREEQIEDLKIMMGLDL